MKFRPIVLILVFVVVCGIASIGQAWAPPAGTKVLSTSCETCNYNTGVGWACSSLAGTDQSDCREMLYGCMFEDGCSTVYGGGGGGSEAAGGRQLDRNEAFEATSEVILSDRF